MRLKHFILRATLFWSVEISNKERCAVSSRKRVEERSVSEEVGHGPRCAAQHHHHACAHTHSLEILPREGRGGGGGSGHIPRRHHHEPRTVPPQAQQPERGPVRYELTRHRLRRQRPTSTHTARCPHRDNTMEPNTITLALDPTPTEKRFFFSFFAIPSEFKRIRK